MKPFLFASSLFRQMNTVKKMNKTLKFFVNLLVIALFAAVGFALASCGQALTGSEQSPQATPQMVKPSATVTATAQPTATPSPWYDLAATQAAIDSAIAEAERVQAEKDLLIVEMTKEAGDTTNQLLLDESYRKNQEVEARITLAFANATATQQAQAEIDERENKRLAMEANTQGVFIAGFYFVLFVIGCLVVAFVVRVIRESAPSEYVNNEQEETKNELGPERRFVPVSQSTDKPSAVPTSDDNFRAWAEIMLKGGSAGENKWTTAESPFTTATYPAFLQWAERMGYVENKTGVGKPLSETGRKFCAEWLARRGFAPVE